MDNCAIVITSIFDNGWLDRVTKEIESSGEKDKTTIIYISDYKTPPSIFEQIKKISACGFKIIAPNLDEQFEYERKLGLQNFFLINSDHRRNLGYLIAYQKGFDFVISMDDDNFPLTENFIDNHRVRLGLQSARVEIATANNAYNNCLLLDNNTFVHPRGFPFNRRDSSEFELKEVKNVKVGVNAGMWTISPDVDAISWLICNMKYEDISSVEDVILSRDTYCPVNSQNTAILREYIPAYYFVRMGFDIGGGLKFDRLGDIYSGYFLQKVVKETSASIGFGMPLVTHERNSHNYLNDANGEWGSLRTIDEFFDWIISSDIRSNSVIETYKNLIESLNDFASVTKFKFMPTATAGFYHGMAYDMSKWITLIEKI